MGNRAKFVDKKTAEHGFNGLIGPMKNEGSWEVRITSFKWQAHFGNAKLLQYEGSY
jgi:hypothetical protein